MVYFVTALPFESRAIFHFWGKAVLLQQQGSMRLFELAPGIRLVEVGLGVEDASLMSRWWTEIPPQVVVNVGISGALVKDFSVGDAVAVQMVCNEAGDTLPLALFSGREWPTAVQVTVPEPVESEEQVQALHRRTGAALVDMELYWIARELQKNGPVPIYSVRVVSDHANQYARQTIRKHRTIIARELRTVVGQVRKELRLKK